MAGTILGMRGFDMGDAQLNTVDRSDDTRVIASNSYAHTGAYSLKLGGTDSKTTSTEWGRWRLSGDPSNPSVSAWVFLYGRFNETGTGTVNHNIRYRLTDGTFVELRWNGATHTYDAYVNGVLFKAGTVEVSVNTWFHVQFYATINAAGNITVLIDGHESINENGNTQPGAADTVDYVYIYGGGGSSYDYVDDLVFGYGGLLGSLRVRERVPNRDASVAWTPSAGSDNYALVDEVPPNDADYNIANSDGLLDQLGLTTIDFATLEEVPVALMPWVRAQMNEGTGDSITVGLDSNGTAVNTQSALSTAWEYYFHRTAVEDPDGGGQPWDTASANAAELTYESA